jgi:hypothetical protein
MKVEYIFFLIFGVVVIQLLYQLVSKGGFRGAMFGAPVIRTVGAMDLGRKGLLRTRLKVHCLEARERDSPSVGIEVVHSTIGSFSMSPVRLTREQAQELSALLSRAANGGAQ